MFPDALFARFPLLLEGGTGFAKIVEADEGADPSAGLVCRQAEVGGVVGEGGGGLALQDCGGAGGHIEQMGDDGVAGAAVGVALGPEGAGRCGECHRLLHVH